uniref:Retrovirus-related Pol polyprotein from transposon TNT 1-94 n=1 Tax=Tanacetum cinerariifolium TaxID=118510 RepID=A0A6L2NPF0_TANCI|nr:retrovirus-related Pol polyprotein from transposon TNT 1-94 [Tanacetum cinerariifolium]
MTDIVPPIPPYFGANISSLIRAGNTTDTINNTTTTDVVQNVVDQNLPQLLDSRGESHVTNVPEFDKEEFSSWKDRFLIFLDGLEPYLLEILENGPFVPLSPLSTPTNPLPEPQNQWSQADRRLANQYKRLKSILISCLPTNLTKKMVKYESNTEGQQFYQNDTLAALYGKYNYEEGLIDQIYKSESTRFTLQGSKALISNPTLQESDSDTEEDQRSSSEFLADLNAEFHERALLANQRRFYKRSERVGPSKKPLDKTNETCFACGKLGHFQKECPSIKTSTPQYPSSSRPYNKLKFLTNTTPQHNQNFNNNQKDYKVKYKGLAAKIAVLTKKIDVMNKALMAVADEPSVGRVDASDERKHVLDYTHIDLHYVEDQRKNLLSKYNSLKQELSSCKSELSDLKHTQTQNNSFQNEITKLSLDNESLKDEISDLEKVIEKWTSSRVTFDQLLTEKISGNIVRAIGKKGMRKEQTLLKEVVFTQSNVLTSETNHEIPSDSESEGNTQRPLRTLPKLFGAEPSCKRSISLPKTTQTTDKVVSVNIKQETETKSPLDPSTKKLLLNLMKEVKGLKEKIQAHPKTSPLTSISESSRSARGKDKIWFRLCKHRGLKNHLTEDCFKKPKCSTCGSTNHLTKEHLEQTVIKRTLAKLNAQRSSKKVPMIPKPYIPCKYYGFNDHHSDEYEFYPGCNIYGSIAHETTNCVTKTPNRKPRVASQRSSKPTVKYSKESGLKVVFGDNSSGDTEGYGSVNCNGITFTKVAYMNGLKHNLISISQLCDANFKVLFSKTQGTMFNQNQGVALISPRRRRDVYVINMTSYNEESNACFFAKASPSVNWLWHKR